MTLICTRQISSVKTHRASAFGFGAWYFPSQVLSSAVLPQYTSESEKLCSSKLYLKTLRFYITFVISTVLCLTIKKCQYHCDLAGHAKRGRWMAKFSWPRCRPTCLQFGDIIFLANFTFVFMMILIKALLVTFGSTAKQSLKKPLWNCDRVLTVFLLHLRSVIPQILHFKRIRGVLGQVVP